MPAAARILVTGAGGFVGGYLCEALAATGATVIGAGLAEGAGSARETISMDLADAAGVAAAVARARPDVVVHLAGQASVATSVGGGAAATWRVNLAGTFNLALALAEIAPAAAVLFASSSEVYGHAFAASPVDEAAAPAPANAYSRSKALAERVLADVLSPGAPLVVARPFNHTGPGQREDFVLPSFAGQIARIEAGLQPPRLRVGTLDVARDMLDVRDVVAAYVALVEAMPRLPPRFTCNIASGAARPLRDYVEMMRAEARAPFEIEVDSARVRPVDLPLASGSAARLHAATGWAPRIPIERTIADLLDDARRRVG